MRTSNISRRGAISLLSASAAVPLVARVGGAGDAVVGASSASNALRIAEGTRFARWTVTSVGPLRRGAVAVGVATDAGGTFELEVLARDASPLAARAPGETTRFAVFIANGGDGARPTVEEHGLAAMAFATLLARAEHAIDASGFLTHASRIESHHAALMTTSRRGRAS